MVAEIKLVVEEIIKLQLCAIVNCIESLPPGKIACESVVDLIDPCVEQQLSRMNWPAQWRDSIHVRFLLDDMHVTHAGTDLSHLFRKLILAPARHV